MKKVKGNKRHKITVIKQISHRDGVYSTGNIINNIVITLHGVTVRYIIPCQLYFN